MPRRLWPVSSSVMNKQGITPSALALRLYLQGPGSLQIGSQVDPQVDRVWFRPLCGGRWSVVKWCQPELERLCAENEQMREVLARAFEGRRKRSFPKSKAPQPIRNPRS